MAALVWDQVVAIAPELATLNATAQGLILGFVDDELDPGAFGGEDAPKYLMARIFLAAHLGRTSQLGGNAVAGPVISESAGGLSRSYANLFSAGQSSGLWVGTTYADMFNALLMSSPQARLPMLIAGRRW